VHKSTRYHRERPLVSPDLKCLGTTVELMRTAPEVNRFVGFFVGYEMNAVCAGRS
jgi:hypothetical protein